MIQKIQNGTCKVFSIKNGTVIDHISAGRALPLIKALKLDSKNKIVTLGMRFKSQKYSFKDIVKIEDMELSPGEVDQVAIFVPTVTINIIRNFKVVKKFKPVMPKEINGFVVCPNPICITNNEMVMTRFYPSCVEKKYIFKCSYCEKTFTEEEIINKTSQ